MRVRTALQGVVFVSVVFFLLPRLFLEWSEEAGWLRLEHPVADVAGTLLLVTGIGVVVYASHLFRVLGMGTPVPIEPPSRLVVSGLYAYSRNPIYVADLAIVGGIFLVEGHAGLLLYTFVLWACVQAWIVLREEPVLRERFGAEYDAYLQRVPRWLGRSGALPY